MCPLDTRRQLPGREEELRATVRVVPSGRPWGPSGNARAGFCPWGRPISNVGAQTQSKSPGRGAIKGEGVMGAGRAGAEQQAERAAEGSKGDGMCPVGGSGWPGQRGGGGGREVKLPRRWQGPPLRAGTHARSRAGPPGPGSASWHFLELYPHPLPTFPREQNGLLSCSRMLSG